MKKCNSCGCEKPLTEFYKGMGKCKICISQVRKEYYENNKQKVIDRVKRYQKTPSGQASRERARIKRETQIFLTSDGSVNTYSIMHLLEKQEYCCAITGEIFERENGKYNYTVDHIIPLSKEGTHTIGNIQLVTMEANMAKSNKTLEEWVDLYDNYF